MPITTWVNGQQANLIAADDRGLAYGDGLFETISVIDASPRFLAYHLQRLELGCQRLNINCDIPCLKQEIKLALSKANNDCSVMKIIVTRASSGRGYQGDVKLSANRIISIAPNNKDYSMQQAEGVSVRLCDHRLPINPALAGIKHLSRLDNVIARNEWGDEGIAEGLMLDMHGHVIEATMSNVFLVSRGVVLTPKLHRCGVEGVAKRVIIEQVLPRLGIKSLVKDLLLENIYQADEVFLCNSLIGVWPVVALGCHHKEVGAMTRDIQQAFAREH